MADEQSSPANGSNSRSALASSTGWPSHAVLRWVALVLMLGILSVAHFATPAQHPWVHEFLFKVTYLLIVLAGLWFGWRGGFYLALLTGGIYIIHIRWQLAGDHGRDQLGLLLELVLYLLIGLVVGWLSDRQRGVQRRLATANTQLQRSLSSLRDKTEALLAAEESLRRTDRLKAAGEIATGLAHEVRNPLGGIVGAAEILANPKVGGKARAEFAAVLTREAKRLDRVISQFLDFARPGSVEGGVCNLHQEIDFVGKLTAGPRGKKKVAFELAEVPNNLAVGVSADALRQVVLNLTLNALAAVPSNGGKIAWRARRDRDWVRVWISDNGPGVQPSVRDRLFEPFIATKDGTGLGLAIVARLMNDVGGNVALDNSDTRGTTFALTLPKAATHANALESSRE